MEEFFPGHGVLLNREVCIYNTKKIRTVGGKMRGKKKRKEDTRGSGKRRTTVKWKE